MKLITIENRGWGSLQLHEGKLPKSRLEFKAGNNLEIYVKGPMTDCYDLMIVKALEYAVNMGLRAIDVRLQNPPHKNRKFETGTRKLL